MLDIKEIRSSIRDFSDYEKDVLNIYTLGGMQKMNVLTEFGLYRLMFNSRKPIAEKFRLFTYKLL